MFLLRRIAIFSANWWPYDVSSDFPGFSSLDIRTKLVSVWIILSVFVI